MNHDLNRHLRYAPEIAVVEIAMLMLDHLRVAVIAAHPRLSVDAPPASREERLAVTLLRAVERFLRAARRYVAYVCELALVEPYAGAAHQLEMF